MTDPMNLHALADGELASNEAHALRDALKTDSRASAEYDAILNLKDVVAKNALRHTDDEAWKGCLTRLDAIDKSKRVEGFVGRYAWALCGVMFAFILSGRYAMRNVQGDTANAADITRALGGGRPVTALDQAKAREYESLLKGVAGGLDRNAVDLLAVEAGAVRDMPAARFKMRDIGGDFTLTRVDGPLNLQDTVPVSSAPGMSAGVADGQNCLVWRTPGHTWLLSGGRSLSQLGELASRLPGAR